MFLIRGNQKTTEEVIQIFKDAVSININEMRKQIRAEQRYESKILAPHGIDINPKTTVARA
jgi:predicted nuclease of restriction endonuclease-like RecB superfamily